MEIRKTRAAEIDAVMDIYAQARKFMAEHDNPNQWKTHKPLREHIERDIAEGYHYVCTEDDEIIGVFRFSKGIDPTYVKIYDGQWLDDSEYAVVHSIASSGKVKGTGSFCLEWAYNQHNNIRIDTHRDNYVMQNLLKKLGYKYCGIIYLADGDERLAFQKI